MLMKIYYIFVVFSSTAQHTAFANVPNYGSFADRLVDSLAEDVPPDVQEQAFKLIRQKAQAFGFNDRLGNHPAEAKVRLREDATPISMPMYTSSPAKRIVIDEQMDKWIKQDVIESSVSPWGAPIVIAYHNGKPRFCVDY